jgi:phosphoribosylformylglycinamidine cyclo-ligase
MSHITGGGLASNLARVIPNSCHVRIDRTTWQPGPIFELIRKLGEISEPDLEATFNMGVGMVAVLPPDSVDEAVRLLAARGLRAWVCGSVTSAGASITELVSVFGQHVAG